MSKLIRISDETYLKLDHIAQNTGFSRQDILNQALINLEREAIFKKAHESYAALRNEPKTWLDEQEELALWDSTLEDGLKDE